MMEIDSCAAVCESLAPELKPLASGLPAHDAALASLEDRTATVLARYDAYVGPHPSLP